MSLVEVAIGPRDEIAWIISEQVVKSIMFCRVGRKKPLKRSRKRIKPRGKFKAPGANPLKTCKRRRSDDEVMQYALQCRTERLMNRTRAEMAFAELLDRRRIPYEIEKNFLNGDRFIIVDFYLPFKNVALEVDGSAHDRQNKYGAGRDRWLFDAYGVKTIRISNNLVLWRHAIQKHFSMFFRTRSLCSLFVNKANLIDAN